MSGCNYVLPKMMQFWLSEPLLRPSERHVHQNGGWRCRLELRSSMPSLLGTSQLSYCSRTCQLFLFKFPQKNKEAKPLVNNVSPLGELLEAGRTAEFWYLLQMQKILVWYSRTGFNGLSNHRGKGSLCCPSDVFISRVYTPRVMEFSI